MALLCMVSGLYEGMIPVDFGFSWSKVKFTEVSVHYLKNNFLQNLHISLNHWSL